MSDTKLYDMLFKKFDESVELSEDKKSIFIKNSKKWNEIALFLYKNKDLKFDYLMCLSGYDLGDSTQFGVAYNFYSTTLTPLKIHAPRGGDPRAGSE